MSEQRWSPTDCLPRSDEEARLLREAFGDPGLQTPQGRGATSDTVSVPACPRCAALEAQLATVEAVLADEQRNVRLETEAHDRTRTRMREIGRGRAALEAEVRRLQETVERLSDDSLMVLETEVSTARALLGELAAAVREQQSAENEPTDAPGATTRMMAATVRVADLLRRAEAEAGGAR